MIIVPGKRSSWQTLLFSSCNYRFNGTTFKGCITPVLVDKCNTEVVVHFVFNPEGGEKFYELTRKNFNRHIAMIVDGVVVSASSCKYSQLVQVVIFMVTLQPNQQMS